jgi:hypothetical protein
MSTRIQLVIDCADPDRLTRFWAEALGYQVPPPPEGFDTWRAYWVNVGVPDEEMDDGDDSLVDPDGSGPRIWFQKVPEGKVVKNRLHLDLDASGGRTVPIDTRKERVIAMAERLIAAGATRVRVLSEEGLDHYGEVMNDPEGNEFCIH